MPKVATEARSMCLELIEAIKLIDQLAYTRNYSQVFEDFIDWMIWLHLLTPNEENPISNYKEKEQEYLLEIWKIIHTETKKRVGLWNEDKTLWYDPLGRLYHCITSKNKSSILGQYFTPEPVVDMIVKMTNPAEPGKLTKILDPACGSGRMGLTRAAHAMAQKTPCWISMIDLDPICTKMAAVNMCLHGFVGEVLCMNGLDITRESYRFGYRIVPLMALIPQEQWSFFQMIGFFKTGQDIKKQYVLIPVSYEQTFLRQSNEQLLLEYEERKQLADQDAKEKAFEALKEKIQARMKGTLLESDPRILDDLTLREEGTKTKKGRGDASSKRDDLNNQLDLFG